MKKFSFLMAAIIALLSVSCDKAEEAEDTTLVPVNVHINDFTISMGEFGTRAEKSAADYANMKMITLAFYSGETEIYKTTQSRGDNSTFGQFSFMLPMGSYTMVVLGYGHSEDDALELTSPTLAAYTGAHARETFAYTQEVNITGTAAVSLNATLDRVVSKLVIESTDGKTDNAVSVRTTFSAGGKSFSPSTGLATGNAGLVNTVVISKQTGEATSTTSYLFLSSDKQDIDVTIDVLDAAGKSISHKEVKGVPMQRNKVVTLRGSLYSAAATSSFQVNEDWLPAENISF